MGIALITATLVSSCKKEASHPAAPDNRPTSNLERRIQDFYARMSSIQKNRTANKNAKVTSDDYISVDSAEFLMESVFNYYTASTADDSSEVSYFNFSFTGEIANDSILSESEASAFMQQIKDSIIVQYNEINYVDKELGLFDLEIQHAIGTNEATFEVSYSITRAPWPRPTQENPSGGTNDVWAVLPVTPCSGTWAYIGPGYNAYQTGTGVTNFTTSTTTTTSTSCSSPNAGSELRRYGINNYKASYAYPNPAHLLTSVTSETHSLTATSAPYYYKTPYGNATPVTIGYLNYDSYVVTVDDAGFHIPSTAAGANFYAHWLNTDMMIFYLGYIPVKIEQHRASRSFVDFQINTNSTPSTTGPGTGGTPILNINHIYIYYYGSETPINKYWPRVSIIDLLVPTP